MSPVHIDELNPETRAKVLQQIEETEGVTTALAVIEPKNHPSYTEAENLARRPVAPPPICPSQMCLKSIAVANLHHDRAHHFHPMFMRVAEQLDF